MSCVNSRSRFEPEPNENRFIPQKRFTYEYRWISISSSLAGKPFRCSFKYASSVDLSNPYCSDIPTSFGSLYCNARQWSVQCCENGQRRDVTTGRGWCFMQNVIIMLRIHARPISDARRPRWKGNRGNQMHSSSINLKWVPVISFIRWVCFPWLAWYASKRRSRHFKQIQKTYSTAGNFGQVWKSSLLVSSLFIPSLPFSPLLFSSLLFSSLSFRLLVFFSSAALVPPC